MNTKLLMGIRIFLGIFMLFFGINKFVGFTAFPPMGETAETLMGIYVSSGFLLLIGAIETIGGLALIFGKFIPLALTFIIAVLFNAVMFHILYNPANIVVSLVAIVLGLVLVYGYRAKFLGFWTA